MFNAVLCWCGDAWFAVVPPCAGLKSLCLGNCSLHHLPPVVASLTGLTRLELQGNALSAAGFTSSGLEPHSIGFAQSLRVLDLTAQGSGRARMRGIPAWVGQCAALTELRLGCSCLGYHGDSGGSGLAAAVAAATAGAGAQANGVGSSGSRTMHHSSSDLGLRGHHTRAITHGRSTLARSLDLGHASSAPPAVANSNSPAGGSGPASPAGVGGGALSAAAVGPEGLSLQQLPVLLPQLQLLVIEGGVWEQRAVRDALQLATQLARAGSSLQLMLPL